MAHQVEKMMYVGETPWHGLGQKFEKAPSIEEAIPAAGLDWKVDRVQLALPDGRPVDRWAVIRSTDKKVLGTVGPGYRLLQNADAFKWFEPFLKGGGAAIETAGSLKGGSRVWIMAKLASKDDVIVKQADDRVAKFLLLAHGHDGTLSVHCGLTPVRVVCSNTLAMARGGTLKLRHSSGLAGTLDDVQKALLEADKRFAESAEVFRALAATKVTTKQVRAYLEQVFGAPRKREAAAAAAAKAAKANQDGKAAFASLLGQPVKSLGKKTEVEALAAAAERAVERRSVADNVLEILERGGRGLDLPGVKGTAWAAYNAATEYVNHERGNDPAQRMNTVWFGIGAARAVLPAAINTFLKKAA